jgi:hypothetical protein
MATWACGANVGEIAVTVAPDGTPGDAEIMRLGPANKLRHITLKDMAGKDMKPAQAKQLITLRDQK